MAGRRTWTEEQLAEAVAESTSQNQVLRRLGLSSGGETWGRMQAHMTRLGLSTSHFLGQAQTGNRGMRYDPRSYFVVGREVHGRILKRAMAAVGRSVTACDRCGITTWMGEPAPLQVEHINGDHRDNRLGNLGVLCANCHCLTPTWGYKKRSMTSGVTGNTPGPGPGESGLEPDVGGPNPPS